MRKMFRWGLFLALAGVGVAAETFSHRLTPEERRQAGLDKLSSAELAALNALIGEHGPVRSEPAQASPPQAPKPAAPIVTPPPAPAPAPAAAVGPRDAPSASAAEQKTSGGGFFKQTQKATPPPPPEKPVVPAIETEVDGDFTGWGNLTVLTMKDGSIWRIENLARPYYTNRVINPRVRIYPAVLNGYWLEFVDLKVRVRVVRLK